MRRLISLGAAALVVLVLAVPAASGKGGGHRCPRFDIGLAPVNMVNIHVHGLNCGFAHKIGRRAVRHSTGQGEPGYGGRYPYFFWHRFDCEGHFRGRLPSYSVDWLCKRGHKANGPARQRLNFRLYLP